MLNMQLREFLSLKHLHVLYWLPACGLNENPPGAAPGVYYEADMVDIVQ